MRKTTRAIVLSGLLIALSIVLTRVLFIDLPLPGFAVTGFRISIGAVPIILAGIALGPVWGLAVGAIADFFGYFLVYSGLPYPLITITSALTGLLPFFIYKLAGKMSFKWRLLVTVTVTQVICAMVLQTLALALFYMGFYPPFQTMSFMDVSLVFFVYRLPFILATIPVFYVLLYYILIGLGKAKLIQNESLKLTQ